MVKRVTAPAEHHLLVNGPDLIVTFGGETLSKFAVAKLLEHKVTSRNFKAGLDFSDQYKARTARNKLATMFNNYVEKEFPAHRADTGVLLRPFVSKSGYSPEQLVIHTFYDKSIIRYIRRVNRALVALGIPVGVTHTEYNSTDLDRIEIVVAPRSPGGVNRSTLHYYRLLCFVPEILGFFKNLSRKACFTEQDAKNNARSKFSGWVGSPREQLNTANSGANEAVAQSAPNNRRGQPADRGNTGYATINNAGVAEPAPRSRPLGTGRTTR